MRIIIALPLTEIVTKPPFLNKLFKKAQIRTVVYCTRVLHPVIQFGLNKHENTSNSSEQKQERKIKSPPIRYTNKSNLRNNKTNHVMVLLIFLIPLS